MSYAIVQKELVVPPLENLQRAIRQVTFLTQYDAHTIANDAYGILVKNLSLENATTLQSALKVEGVEVEMVEERTLPALPATKFVRRLDCLPEALMIYDPLGRSFPLEWRHILLLAAGSVRLNDFTRKQTSVPVTRYDAQGYPHVEVVTETRTKEELNFHLLLEIILHKAVQRYSVAADKFSFVYLGERMTGSVPQDFRLLVQDLARFAPQAAINRGAYYLRENADEIFSYPSKNAFAEEITWLLWRLAQSNPP